MPNIRLITATVILSGVMGAGCTSQVAKQDQYSGFISDYSNLKETKSASGKEVMRWRDPAFKTSDFTQLVFQPVTFYPAPKPTEQISDQTLQQVLAYANDQLRAALGKRFKLVSTPGPNTAIFRAAITGVDTANEGLKAYQVIPVALVVSGAMAASGTRTQDTELYMEGEFLNAETGKPVLKVVRKGFGKKIDNASQKVTVDDLKVTIDDMVQDIKLFE